MVKHYLNFSPDYNMLKSEDVTFLNLWFDFKNFYQQISRFISEVCLEPLLTMFDGHTWSNIISIFPQILIIVVSEYMSIFIFMV